ncbi:hypothetical protein F511_14457 [Dorcoceras hygrometricum]|uniref:Uncharacterized protein n=1 Tax=Dorcoceras hygrometricum TaxID=472368 RepID=A0A2Z7AFE9_9LAMI|nr:hypothetical protein F511_14457 [Dorcoceras hygrometricum]
MVAAAAPPCAANFPSFSLLAPTTMAGAPPAGPPPGPSGSNGTSHDPNHEPQPKVETHEGGCPLTACAPCSREIKLEPAMI